VIILLQLRPLKVFLPKRSGHKVTKNWNPRRSQ